MRLPRIQYITHPDERFEDLSWVHRLHDNGVKWIQLRIKEDDFLQRNASGHYLAFFHETADKMRAITSALGMILTINDLSEVARFSNSDGLHMGQEDALMELNGFPQSFITGGTANSLVEIKCFDKEHLTYFGVGPFRFTATKTKLKPVLGTDGYVQLLEGMRREGYNQPVFAIGGIEPADIPSLLEAGVYGVAVSSALFNTGHSPEVIRSFTNKIQDYVVENS